MAKVKTHYDNLKVVRDAPPEIIRAAYKTLSQKYHPDKNPGNADAARIMAILNEAYRVLSDPELRREHDAWIRRQESVGPGSVNSSSHNSAWDEADADAARTRARAAARDNFKRSSHTSQPSQSPTAQAGSFMDNISWTPFIVLGGVFGVALLGVIVFGQVQGTAPKELPQASAADSAALPGAASGSLQGEAGDSQRQLGGDDLANPVDAIAERLASESAGAKWKRPSTAPNGNQWPFMASYLVGEPRLATAGYSELTIDASRFDTDVHVKLVRLDGGNTLTVRQAFIPAHGRFVIEDLSPGHYDVRYRDLDTGHLARSDAFDIEEVETESGVQFTRMEMTLYKIAGGNMKTHPLDEQEF